LRRLHIEDRARVSAIPDVTLARVNLTDRRVALEWKQGTLDPPASSIASPNWLQGLSIREGKR